eukprot:NODE_10964_length_1317_cov_5.373950.p1 GENE.NODE_10964_length_1317_cov_5.373950~~NODE_10964_length_1317_cov_5.373950.p1  ORF type:complete len:362 (-),score=114.43 NODE_10964_length_1317_cov_5.373950:230-1156(-)
MGKIVMKAAAEHMTPVILELGGKNPCIVDRSANVGAAARGTAWGGMMNAGQLCIRPNHIMVHQEIADKFLTELKKSLLSFYDGKPQESEWFGRIVNTASVKRLQDVIEKDKDFVVFGGGSDEETRFVAPTIIDYGTDREAFMNSAAMSQELFGPILPIYRFTDFEDCISFIKADEKPLALYCYTEDKKQADMLVKRTASGATVINNVVSHATNHHLVFGGVGNSGTGGYHGKHSFMAFSHEKSVMHCKGNDNPMRYPPIGPKARGLISTGLRASFSHNFDTMAALFSINNLVIFILLCIIGLQRSAKL